MLASIRQLAKSWIKNPLTKKKLEIEKSVKPVPAAANPAKIRKPLQFLKKEQKFKVPPIFMRLAARKNEKVFKRLNEKTSGQRSKQLMYQCIKHASYAQGIASTRKLCTTGPLEVSDRVKQSLRVNLDKRHEDFSYVVQFVRNSLLGIANVSLEEYTAIPMNGSGMFATEASLRTIMGNKNRKLLVMENGLHGHRIAQICRACTINVKVIPMSLKVLCDTLCAEEDIDGVIVVHCETSTGMVNPINEIGQFVKKISPGCLYFVDALETFGAVRIDMTNVDFLMSSSCSSLQGVPGISFVIANKEKLQSYRSKENGFVLDIGAQFDELERSGQFRFTSPVHVMLAFKEALIEHKDEGGTRFRGLRYRKNTSTLKDKMREMGFKQLFNNKDNPDGIIMTSYHYPDDPLFVFNEFSARLNDAGYVILPEISSAPNILRIGTIGNLYPEDMQELAISIKKACQEMRIDFPLETPKY